MKNKLCKYKDFFGEPNKGVHSYRIFNIAIVDMLLTIIAAFIISLLYVKIYKANSLYKAFLITFLILFIIGIGMHKLFCVETTLTKLVFF